MMEAEDKPNKGNEVKYVSLTPFLTSLMKPSADYLGEELRTFLSNQIEQWTKQKQSQNLRSHIQGARAALEGSGSEKFSDGDILQQLEIFDEWVEGAQDIDPREKELSYMWRKLLAEIASGNKPSKLLLRILKNLDGDDARILMQLRDNPMHLDMSGRNDYFLRQLSGMELVCETNREWVMLLPIAFILVSLIAVRWIDSSFYDSIKTFGDGIRFMMENSIWVLLPFFLGGAIAAAIFTRIPKWKLTWLGEDLVSYAPTIYDSKSAAEQGDSIHD